PLSCSAPHPALPSFPTRRSSDLDSLALSPDGHGGSLRALHRSGALVDMRKRGVEHLSYFQVDNPLVHVIDPLYLGVGKVLDAALDRKSTRLNSSHLVISYAVFCL